MSPSSQKSEKRVLICYASIGSGHRSAAIAVQLALQERGFEHVELLDVFDEHDQNNTLQEALSSLSTRFFPRIYNWSWQTGALMPVFQFSTRLPFIRRRVLARCREFSPDLAICTHALPCAVLARMPADSRPRLLAVATDFQAHPYWPLPHIDAFVVPSLLAEETLRSRGFPEGKNFRLGIPTIPQKAEAVTRPSDSKLHILVIAGSRQVGPYRAIRPRVLELLTCLRRDPMDGVSWRFIFGADQRLMEKARQLAAGCPEIALLGLVDDMSRCYRWADLVAVKPSGLVLAESFANGKPVLLLSKGVGQERANAGFVQASQAGLLVESPEAWTEIIASIKAQPGLLKRLQLNASVLGRPDSAAQVARLAETLMQS